MDQFYQIIGIPHKLSSLPWREICKNLLCNLTERDVFWVPCKTFDPLRMLHTIGEYINSNETQLDKNKILVMQWLNLILHILFHRDRYYVIYLKSGQCMLHITSEYHSSFGRDTSIEMKHNTIKTKCWSNEVSECSLAPIISSFREISIMLSSTSVWSVYLVVGPCCPSSWSCRQPFSASCPPRSISRSVVSRRPLHWLPWCHPVTLPEPGYATCGPSGRQCASSTGISRWSAGSVSSHDKRSVHDSAVTIELHTPAAQK